MNTIKFFAVIGLAALMTPASAQEQGVFRRGAFTFSAGYSWRQQAKTDFGGASAQPAASGGVYENGSAEPGTGNWAGKVVDNVVVDALITDTVQYLYALELTRSDSVGVGNGEDGMSGLNLAAGYDFWDNEVFAIGAELRFAGYWGLENGSTGGYSRYTDYFPFAFPYPGGTLWPVQGDDDVGEADPNYRKYLAGGQGGRVTLKSDLYQIGLGPKVTWHVLSCVDIYGGVEALCTFVNSELDAGGASTDEVNCLWGVGGHVGFTGWMTENIGFFGQVGYEWIDEDEVSVRGVRATTDYSSLVLSVGIQFQF